MHSEKKNVVVLCISGICKAYRSQKISKIPKIFDLDIIYQEFLSRNNKIKWSVINMSKSRLFFNIFQEYTDFYNLQYFGN